MSATQPPQSPIDWRTMFDAITAWYRDATGLEVAWAKQPRRPQSGKAFGTLQRMPGLTILHNDATSKVTDPDTGLPYYVVSGMREMTIQCQAFTDDVTPEGHAVTLMALAQSTLSMMPSVSGAFARAGMAIVNAGAVIDLSDIAGADWQTRASMDVLLRFASTISDAEFGKIESVRTTLTFKDTVSGEPIVLDTVEDLGGS